LEAAFSADVKTIVTSIFVCPVLTAFRDFIIVVANLPKPLGVDEHLRVSADKRADPHH
jgi:hypothetical protein